MALVWSLDGKMYEVDEETLARSRISDEEAHKLASPPPLPAQSAGPSPGSRSGPAEERRNASPSRSGSVAAKKKTS